MTGPEHREAEHDPRCLYCEHGPYCTRCKWADVAADDAFVCARHTGEIKHQEIATDPYSSGDDAWCGHEASCPNGPGPHRQRLSCWDVARARTPEEPS